MKYHVYTDGACSGNRVNEGIGGYAYLIINNKDSIAAEGGGFEYHTTNNRMEMTAVIEGLRRIGRIHNDTKHVQCIVCSDSKYVCSNYLDYFPVWKQRGWRKSDGRPVLNRDLWKKLDQIASTFETVSFHWVKGHADDQFNNMVDQKACGFISQAKAGV